VGIKKAVAFAKTLKAKHFLTSAKEGTGIATLFATIANSLYGSYMSKEGTDYELNQRPSRVESFKLGDSTRGTEVTMIKKKGGCCK
jgi:hypothetical protein